MRETGSGDRLPGRALLTPRPFFPTVNYSLTGELSSQLRIVPVRGIGRSAGPSPRLRRHNWTFTRGLNVSHVIHLIFAQRDGGFCSITPIRLGSQTAVPSRRD